MVPEDRDYNDDLERRSWIRRSDDEGNPLLMGLPTWVKATALLGPTTVISLFFVWMLGNKLPEIEKRQAALEIQMIEIKQAEERQTTILDRQFRLQQWMCSMAAKTEGDRTRCFD